MRRTLKQAAEFRGVGLHGGQPVQMTIHPDFEARGIRFIRVDVDREIGEIRAHYELVSDTRLCTNLTNGHGVSVGTVEHVMAALSGSGVTDAVIRLDGPEVPIMDGSAIDFVREIRRVGLHDLSARAMAMKILKPVVVEKDGKRAAILPDNRFEMEFTISFADPAIGEQTHSTILSGGAFIDELADCRTFGHLAEVEHLRHIGLARGGGLENAIVVDSGRVLNPEGLRRPDEFVRHKMLDAVGDLALAGCPIIDRYVGVKAGHEMTNMLLRALFADPDAWVLMEMPESVTLDARLGMVPEMLEDQQVAV